MTNLSEDALEKCRERWADFQAAGWSKEDIVGPKGLAKRVRPHHDIGRIFPFVVELLGRPNGHGPRPILTVWKGASMFELIHRHGREVVIPDHMRRRKGDKFG